MFIPLWSNQSHPSFKTTYLCCTISIFDLKLLELFEMLRSHPTLVVHRSRYSCAVCTENHVFQREKEHFELLDLKYFSCGMVHQGISRRVLRGTTYDPGHWTFYFCRRRFGLVISVVVPLMLAVLPYARGRGFNSRSRLLFIVWTNLCFSSFISLYIVQTTSIWPYSHAKRFGRPLMYSYWI
jgi:hypothetical protein